MTRWSAVRNECRCERNRRAQRCCVQGTTASSQARHRACRGCAVTLHAEPRGSQLVYATLMDMLQEMRTEMGDKHRQASWALRLVRHTAR